jgi:hypothetical protein
MRVWVGVKPVRKLWFRNVGATFDHISHYQEGYRLRFPHRGIFGIAISHHSGEIGHGSEDTAVFFTLDLDEERLNRDHD